MTAQPARPSAATAAPSRASYEGNGHARRLPGDGGDDPRAQAEAWIRANTGVAYAAAFAVGLLLGLWLRR